ncbi:MAG: DJ-1 family glyoxalase III [Eubacteriales bacterium]
MEKIAVFFAEGFEEIEGLTVVDLCRRADIEVQMVSTTGNKIVTGSHNIPVVMDCMLEDVDFTSLDMMVLPGGMPGTKNLEENQDLMAALDSFYDKEKWIAAICAAPSIFGHRGYLENKKAGIFPGLEKELIGATVSFDEVSVDGKIITSRGMGTAISFSLAIIEMLQNEEAADQLGTKIVYK